MFNSVIRRSFQRNYNLYWQIFVRKMSAEKSNISKEELRKRLTPMQYHVTQEKGTEKPFSGCYDKFNESGAYECICCGQQLFASTAKYDSGCGWPAFNDVIAEGKVKLSADTSHGMQRTEVTCAVCHAHLGHVFNDGPAPKRRRFCINSASLLFKPSAK